MKKLLLTVAYILTGTTLFAQHDTAKVQEKSISDLEQKIYEVEDALKEVRNLSVSGYIQTQFQYGEKDASLKVGSVNENKEKSYNRVGIRRGRIKFAYTRGIGTGVFQLDLTEKGLGLKDAYLRLSDPWLNSISASLGVFDRPFGYEISYSSSLRESPERSTIFQTLFPEERDLGAKITLQAPKTSPWSILKLDVGLFAGNGIKSEIDNHKDFIGQLSINNSIKDIIKWGAGISYYNGGVYQGKKYIYKNSGNGFIVDSSANNLGSFAKREYVGFNLYLTAYSAIGLTKITSEYLFGTQPGAKSNSKSPNAATLPTNDVYIRQFNGGYVMLVQDFGTLPVSAIVKYDWYDPNTKSKGDEIGKNNTDAGDVALNTTGFGLQWKINTNFRLTGYYELVQNEKCINLKGYETDKKDNAFTCRLQYKF